MLLRINRNNASNKENYMHIVHTDPMQQPVAAELAQKIHQALPAGSSNLCCATNADLDEAEVVLAIFSLKQGSFAPTVPCFRELADKKVAYLAILIGEVDTSRVHKTVWGVKKQFCGNEVVGAYLCPSPDDVVWGPTEAEVTKSVNFARRLLDEHGNALSEGQPPLAVNY